MVFSSSIFLFFFLPIVLVALIPFRLSVRNALLLTFSLFFFAWGETLYLLVLLLSILVNYGAARFIAGTGKKRLWLTIGVVINLGLLAVHKYYGLALESLNYLFEWFEMPLIKVVPSHLPIGISFFTFQGISYLVDVYRKPEVVQRSLLKVALYISFFPQLIAGPIVRYKDIAAQLSRRRQTWSQFAGGVERFVLGLAKKVLVANFFGQIADELYALPVTDLTTDLAWLAAIAYSIQIYFDFSGYSDMAIGLGKFFGFRLPENFRFPYRAKSVREFWRRWHISLSNWFRDYLYIPLGGNRKKSGRVYFNLFIVFFLTGLWHGDAYTFVIWGLLHGAFMIMERLIGTERFDRVWAPLRHTYLLLVVVIGWVFFRAESLDQAVGVVQRMFSWSEFSATQVAYYLTPEFWFYFAIAVLGSAGLFRWLILKQARMAGKSSVAFASLLSLRWVVIFALFGICALAVSSGTYNPFIYFKF